MGELVGTFALAQDNAFGQPLESQFRSCLLAGWLAQEAGLDRAVRDTVYWVALLRYVGCTGHAYEVSSLFGDEIAIRAQTLVHDAANPDEVMSDVIDYASARVPPDEREQFADLLRAGAMEWATHNFASGCEVGDVLVERLGFGSDVREALRFTFERWNGYGFPAGARADEIPIAMRVVHLSQDMEAIGRRFSAARALEAARERRDRTYDPALADLFVAHGADWFALLDKADPWDAVLGLEPAPRRTLSGADLDDALTVLADFVDLKSPYMSGHSRRCADLVTDAAAVLAFDADATTIMRRAALVHELGTTAIPNSIWDKPGPLTRAEIDRVQMHTMLTEQMLGRSPALAALNPVAAAHHERADGSGYHKHLALTDVSSGAALLAATEVYVALTADRADRPAFSADYAAAELRRLASAGALAADATDAVLSAAGHVVSRRAARRQNPGGLSGREMEVLRLAGRGMTAKAIGDELFISPKTVDHHIQHLYSKIGVSTRAAAALWAMQNGVINDHT